MMKVMMKIFFCCSICLFHESCRERKQKINIKCEAFDTTAFLNAVSNKWPSRKPTSIVDAVSLLDKMEDDNFRCSILKMKDEDLYFNLGLKIRNDWVRHGTESIKNQLFDKLKLSSVDYTSGLIIDLYRRCLNNGNENLVDIYVGKKRNSNDSMIKVELVKIQKELYDLGFRSLP